MARDFFWGEFCDWYLELIKRRIQDESEAPVARQILAVILDQVLRLLHPFVPFITEQIWGYLNEQMPARGISEKLPVSELCVLAVWPTPWEAWEDSKLEEEFGRLKNVISRLRELRSRYQVSPSKALPGAVKASGEALASLRRHEHLIIYMAKLTNLELGEDIKRPKNAATQLGDDFEILLGEVLDPKKERARLEDQKSKMSKQLEASQKKLSNDSFVSRAPAEIVQAERSRVTDLQEQIAVLEKSLEALDG